MRILSISGQNIASLAQPFCIDFTQEPLASAGLFAITGETGAGKSSILDTMCLALYGDAPRLSGGAASDETPDASGDTIKAKDARAILRRGAASGHAEVRFTARDGADYIAKWSIGRARDKSDGKLRAVSRALVRASDMQILSSQNTLVNEQIIALTGLTYEEFRRTVLLAQGDFDAFLRSGTNERAGLLEKVTGTGIYRAVSTRIFERTAAAQQHYNSFVQRRAFHNLLEPENLAELITERTQLETEITASGQQKQGLQAAIDRHNRHTAAQTAVTAAQAALDDAQRRQAAAADIRAELVRIERAAPLRLPYAALQQSQTLLAAANDALSVAGTQASSATESVRLAREQAQRAAEAMAEREARFKAFAPHWDAASDLDARLRTAAQEVGLAQSHVETATLSAAQEQAALAALHAKHSAASAAQLQAQEGLDHSPADCALAADWGQIQQRLGDFQAARSDMRAAEHDTTLAQAEIQRLALQLAELGEQATRAQQAEADLTTRADQLAAKITALDATDPATKSAELALVIAALADLARSESEHHTARTEQAAASESHSAALAEIETATATLTRADQDRARAEIEVSALTAPSERADLAVSDLARDLRLRLEPGVPCPVCGSGDHPVHADTALADLARDLRQRLTLARQSLSQATLLAADAQRRLDRARDQAEQAQILGKRSGDALIAIGNRWGEARLRARPFGQDIAAQPGQALGQVAQLQAQANAAQRALQDAQATLAQARRDQSALALDQTALRRTIAAADLQRQDLTAQTATAQSKLALAQHKAQTAKAQQDRLAALLSPMLRDTGEDLTREGLLQRLTARVARITALQRDLDGARTLLAELAPLLAAATSRSESAVRQMTAAKSAHDTRESDLRDLRAQRAELLGGEDTATHRSRENAARQQALAALTEAQAALSAATSAASAAEANLGHAQASKTAAESALHKHRLALTEALALAQISEADMLPLLARNDTEIASLRQKLRGVDDLLVAAQGTLTARLADLDAARALGLPPEPPETLTQALQAIDRLTATQSQRIGAILAALERDAKAREAVAELDREAAGAKAELEVWQAVNMAIGASNGDKFVRMAQSITLDVLVEHANTHLADLSPRYRLRRAADLALQVEDCHMANEARATRSLSGGERFLVSLALALALSRMGDKGGLAATLFIDEGFGSLDSDTLDIAIDALERLQSQGRQVGVISHVEAMKDRIATQVAVRRQSGGRSTIEISSQKLGLG